MSKLNLLEYDPFRYQKVNDSYQVVAIQNFGSSGTLFMQSLLDGHPQILSTPARYMRQFYDFWFRVESRISDPKKLTRQFMDFHRYWFEPAQAIKSDGLQALGQSKDKAAFIQPFEFAAILLRYLNHIETLTSKQLLIAVNLAYNEALGRDTSGSKLIIFPLLSLPIRFQNGQGIIQDFPELKVLHMIREPLKTLGSSIKTIISDNIAGGPTENALAQILCDHMQQWYPNDFKAYGSETHPETQPRQSMGLRLEDLHQKPEETLQALCHWLSIDWHDSLLSSTFNDLKWWNRPTSKSISGFNQEIIEQPYSNYFNPFDRFRLKVLSRQHYLQWNYPLSKLEANHLSLIYIPILILWPFKSEWRTISHRVKQLNQWLLTFNQLIYQWLIIYHSGILKHLFKLNQPERSHQRIGKLLGITVKPILICSMIIRDYVMTRYWAYCGWIKQFSSRKFVPLLTIEKEN